MRYILVLISFTLIIDRIVAREFCHACFDGICYTKSVIYRKHPVSGQLAIDRNENVIYFHYESRKSSDHTVSFDLDDVRFHTVPNIKFSFAKTVDQNTRDVYIGGANGVFKYSPLTNRTTLYGLPDKTIWHMEFKDMLYYTIFMTKGLFTYQKQSQKSIQSLNNFIIDDFIIDKNNTIYFMSNFTAYMLKKGDKKPLVFSNSIYSMSVDSFGNAYFVKTDKGLFKIDYNDGKLIDVGVFASGAPFRIVFDKFNNIIFYDSDTSRLYYLVPNYAMCKVKSEGVGRKFKKKVSRIKLKQK